MFKRLLAAALISAAQAAICAHAQSTFPTPQSPQGGPSIGGLVMMCLNGAGQAIACPLTSLGATPTSSQVSCGTSATVLLAADQTKASRQISNQSGQTVYLGGAGVTTTTGYAVPTGYGYDASHEAGILYCVAASAATVSTLQY